MASADVDAVATLSFSGLHIQDKSGARVADVAVEVSRKGVRLTGRKGELGKFPFQTILSWSRNRDTALGLIVVANGGEREIVLHAVGTST